ncbi:MAG: UDP-N-acetylmuramate dehydrogenase [Opitutae bacterium]|nr:UDP-N-acetylmuramate dehydrogenase [Opitutae bacterium]
MRSPRSCRISRNSPNASRRAAICAIRPPRRRIRDEGVINIFCRWRAALRRRRAHDAAPTERRPPGFWRAELPRGRERGAAIEPERPRRSSALHCLCLEVERIDLHALGTSAAVQARWGQRAPPRVNAIAQDSWSAFLAAVRPLLGATTKLVERELLGPKTTMRVGGPARVYAEPANEADLATLLAAAHARGLPVFMLGRGSNLVVPDEGVDGLVISLTHPDWQTFEPQPDGRVWVGAGLRLKNLCGLAAKAGLSGFEFMEGIPASVGGALRMNAGAMGGWTFDVVDEVHLLTLAGAKRVLKKAAMHVDYRHCAELETAVALGAFLAPRQHADAAAIKQQIETYTKKRQESQPREPSAGCIFKNPPGTSAGKVIDECGLKGERIGGAEVSRVHANFIVNRDHATAADILALVRVIRARVKAARGIDLEPEVMLFGSDWRKVL